MFTSRLALASAALTAAAFATAADVDSHFYNSRASATAMAQTKGSQNWTFKSSYKTENAQGDVGGNGQSSASVASGVMKVGATATANPLAPNHIGYPWSSGAASALAEFSDSIHISGARGQMAHVKVSIAKNASIGATTGSGANWAHFNSFLSGYWRGYAEIGSNLSGPNSNIPSFEFDIEQDTSFDIYGALGVDVVAQTRYDFGYQTATASATMRPIIEVTTGTGRSLAFASRNGFVQPQAVPEPATMAALGLGAFGLLKRRRK